MIILLRLKLSLSFVSFNYLLVREYFNCIIMKRLSNVMIDIVHVLNDLLKSKHSERYF